ncbi:hypothetical protein Tco_0205957 [Tanacetum coccineum]
MSSDPKYQWEDLLDIDDFDLLLTPVLRPCNRHVCEIIAITSTQNTDGIVQLDKIRKQSDIHEGGDDPILSIQEYMKQVVEDVGEDEDFNRDIKTFLKNGKLKQVVAIIKSCSPNALSDLKVIVKDLSSTLHGSINGVGRSRMLIEEEEIVKLVEEEEMADLELHVCGNVRHVCGNVIDQEYLYKFDEEALDLVLEEEARESRAHEVWLEKCRQQEEEDAEHERQLLGYHGTI